MPDRGSQNGGASVNLGLGCDLSLSRHGRAAAAASKQRSLWPQCGVRECEIHARRIESLAKMSVIGNALCVGIYLRRVSCRFSQLR